MEHSTATILRSKVTYVPEALPGTIASTAMVIGRSMLCGHPVPSDANFVFVEVGPMAKEFCDVLLRAGVIVRPLGWMGFPDAMRVSVGTPAENDEFLAVMRKCWPAAMRPAAPAERMAR